MNDNVIKNLFPSHADASLAKMINFINEAIVVFSSTGSIEIVNSQAATLIGGKRMELLGENILEFISDNNLSLKKQIVARANGGSVTLASHPQEITLIRLDGSSVAVDISISDFSPIDAEGRQLYLSVLHDLTTHKAEFGLLKERATTDHLTGLANRHHFDDVLDQQWARAKRENAPLSLILLDVDYFKQINDTYGHLAGDRCLQRIGETIKLGLPHRDALAARYGGEEFALILPGCNAHTAHLLAMRIKRHIGQLRFGELNQRVDPFLTVSIGVVTQEGKKYSGKSTFLEAADTLLYRAKSQGRNQICY